MRPPPHPLTRLVRLLGLAFVLAFAAAAEPPTLFPTPWDDLSPFRADLTDEAWEEARTLADRPVYHLDFDLGDDLSTLRVRQQVRVVNRDDAPLDDLVFHVYPALLGADTTVGAASVDGRPVAVPAAVPDDGLLRVVPAEPVAPGASVAVALALDFVVPTTSERNYGIFALQDGVLSLAHAYALLAARRAGGWDLDPPAPYGDLTDSETAFYLLRVTAPDGVTVTTSGARLSREAEGGRQRLTFAAGPVRDVFVSAGAGLETALLERGDLTLRATGTPAQMGGLALALDDAAAAFAVFESLFGPYPYREFDLVPIVTDALGIEFPGIVALSTELLGPGASTLREGTTAHEVAHQWFYGLLASDQVSEPWLDEALAQYATLRYYGERYGPGGAAGFRASLEGRWDRIDRSAVPIGGPTAGYDPRAYGAVVYGLGPLVIEWLGDEFAPGDFDAFWRDYVRAFRWRPVDGGDFRALAERDCGCDLDAFFARWIDPP